MGRVPGNSYCHLLTKHCKVIPVNAESQVHSLWTGYSRHPAFLLSLLLLPQRSSLGASSCGEGNAILTQFFSLQLKQFEHVCSLPWYAEGPIYSAMLRVHPSLVNGTGLLTGIRNLLSQLNEWNS